MPTWVTRTSTLTPAPTSPLFNERVVYGRSYSLQQTFGGPSPPTDSAARVCCFQHSVFGDNTGLVPWTSTCAALGVAPAPDVAWPGSFNAFLQVGLTNTKDDALPFTPTSYSVFTQKTAMRLTVDTTGSNFAAMVTADLGGPVWSSYEVLSLTANLTFTHSTGSHGTGWTGVVRTRTGGPDTVAHWIKPAELASYPVFVTRAPGTDTAASLAFVPDPVTTTTFRQELLSAVDAAETTSAVDLGNAAVQRDGSWQVQAPTYTVTYRYLPVVRATPPLWQRQRIGAVDSPEGFSAGLVTPQSSPWQGGTL